jgi:hypothetical protein
LFMILLAALYTVAGGIVLHDGVAANGRPFF